LTACQTDTRTPASRVKKSATVSVVREDALARARVWVPPPVPSARADLSRNPPGPGAFDAAADVDCEFRLAPIGGSTPKFECTLPDGDHVKVKYGALNGELPAEVAATRLLSALGFPTDRMYKVHSVRCHGCPPLPQQALQCLAQGQMPLVCLQGASAATVVTFAPAVIERPLDGRKIETDAAHGWSWYELEKIDATSGGATRAQVDALRLLAVVLAHWDNKDANQKLLCPPGVQGPDGGCRAPIAAIGDLGSTFGPWKVDLQNWSRVPVWADARACRVSMKALPFAGATFPDTQISEAGRQVALDLLRPLTRDQLNALFAESGMAAFSHVLAAARQPSAWTEALLDKVRQIDAGGPCPAVR